MDHTPNPAVMLMLADQSVPWLHRAVMLKDLLENINPATEPLVMKILELLTNNSGEALYREKVLKLDALLKEIHEGSDLIIDQRLARLAEANLVESENVMLLRKRRNIHHPTAGVGAQAV